MSRHQRLQRPLRSPVRHGKLLKNRRARQCRRREAFLSAVVIAGALPGELIPYRDRAGNLTWLDFGAWTQNDVRAVSLLAAEDGAFLTARGLT